MALKKQRIAIGDRIRSVIEARGMKHSWVASEAGITAATLSNILTGRTPNPTFSVVAAIAEAIGEPLGTLIGEQSAPLLESEHEVLREAIEILERRVLRVRVDVASAGLMHVLFGEAEGLPRHEIPAAMARRGARLAFRAIGDSMVEEGIRDGDILYVKPAADLRSANGRIVVCRVADSLYVRKLTATSRGIRLQAGSSYLDIRDSDSLRILGVVVAHLGEL